MKNFFVQYSVLQVELQQNLLLKERLIMTSVFLFRVDARQRLRFLDII